MEPLKKTVAFKVSEEDYIRGQELPRKFDLSGKLREAYKKILNEGGV